MERKNRGMGVENKKRRGKIGSCEETMGIWVWKTGDKRKTEIRELDEEIEGWEKKSEECE